MNARKGVALLIWFNVAFWLFGLFIWWVGTDTDGNGEPNRQAWAFLEVIKWEAIVCAVIAAIIGLIAYGICLWEDAPLPETTRNRWERWDEENEELDERIRNIRSSYEAL